MALAKQSQAIFNNIATYLPPEETISLRSGSTTLQGDVKRLWTDRLWKQKALWSPLFELSEDRNYNDKALENIGAPSPELTEEEMACWLRALSSLSNSPPPMSEERRRAIIEEALPKWRELCDEPILNEMFHTHDLYHEDEWNSLESSLSPADREVMNRYYPFNKMLSEYGYGGIGGFAPIFDSDTNLTSIALSECSFADTLRIFACDPDRTKTGETNRCTGEVALMRYMRGSPLIDRSSLSEEKRKNEKGKDALLAYLAILGMGEKMYWASHSITGFLNFPDIHYRDDDGTIRFQEYTILGRPFIILALIRSGYDFKKRIDDNAEWIYSHGSPEGGAYTTLPEVFGRRLKEDLNIDEHDRVVPYNKMEAFSIALIGREKEVYIELSTILVDVPLCSLVGDEWGDIHEVGLDHPLLRWIITGEGDMPAGPHELSAKYEHHLSAANLIALQGREEDGELIRFSQVDWRLV